MESVTSNSLGTYVENQHLSKLSPRYGALISFWSLLVTFLYGLIFRNSLYVDGINITLPLPEAESAGERSKPWPHVDQSPNRRWKHCVQGIVNLVGFPRSRSSRLSDDHLQEENGPQDGGLMVLSGSLPLFNEYFDTHPDASPDGKGGWQWRDANWYNESQLKWFYDRGCKWVKVEAEPGDLILWDSRTIHYGAVATGEKARVATCEWNILPNVLELTRGLDVCYKPASDIQPEMADARRRAATEYISTVSP